ncbi:hypothetical protein TNCV_1500401 [Trichonephila clavipes]|nr:hypothetical protein TNCV_1500401 [Trichonephila clavipes]
MSIRRFEMSIIAATVTFSPLGAETVLTWLGIKSNWTWVADTDKLFHTTSSLRRTSSSVMWVSDLENAFNMATIDHSLYQDKSANEEQYEVWNYLFERRDLQALNDKE